MTQTIIINIFHKQLDLRWNLGGVFDLFLYIKLANLLSAFT